jgi:hypothetical protein
MVAYSVWAYEISDRQASNTIKVFKKLAIDKHPIVYS